VHKKRNPFEPVFHSFISQFGGEVLEEASTSKTADYLFRKQNIVAELKCLMEDQTAAVNQKVNRMVQKWNGRNRGGQQLPIVWKGGVPYLEFRNAPQEIRAKWVAVLKAPLYDLVARAHRQIRSTIEQHNLDSAKGLVLIFNAYNLLHSDFRSFELLLLDVLRKKTPEGERRFPFIHAVIYFSLDVKTADGKSFWAAVRLQTGQSDDTGPMRQFQHDLEQAWYEHLRTRGIIVRQSRGT
jgi:hypothetical protein